MTLFRPCPSVVACAGLLASAAAVAERRFCEPTPEIQQELEKAEAAAPKDATFDLIAAPFRALRDRLPEDLFVHLRYQDVVTDNGIEGHRREMLAEYLKLRLEHPDAVFYLYLHGRALEGRATPLAVRAMDEILAREPGFAPALRTLAEIHGSPAFRDRKKERSERGRFEAACPRNVVARRPAPLPQRSALFTDPQGKWVRNLDPADVPAEVHRALQQDEWRAQRIRSFDWYSVAEKRQAVQELHAEYWRGWQILVSHYRRTGQTEEANNLLSEMQERLTRLEADPSSTVLWTAAATLLDLYAQGRQRDKIRETLARLEASSRARPDAKTRGKLSQLKIRYGAK
jgi:hypothetical protein